MRDEKRERERVPMVFKKNSYENVLEGGEECEKKKNRRTTVRRAAREVVTNKDEERWSEYSEKTVKALHKMKCEQDVGNGWGCR